MTFNTTERLNDTDAHLADYSLNDSCISPAHAQTGSNWAPVYGTPADGTETKHKRISFFSPIRPLLSSIRPWTIIVTLFDQFYRQLLLILLSCLVVSYDVLWVLPLLCFMYQVLKYFMFCVFWVIDVILSTI